MEGISPVEFAINRKQSNMTVKADPYKLLSQIKKDLGINITSELYKRIIIYFDRLYKGVIPKSYSIEDFTKARIYSARDQLKRIEKMNISPKTCLDAGCGIGVFAAVANIKGFNFYGYDIDREAVNIAKKLFLVNKIPQEKISLAPILKYAKNKFDLITSFEVVEHLSDMDMYFKRLRNIIATKGVVLIETPNYMIPYEPHYYVFIPPGPKMIKKFFCRKNGARDGKYLDSLNLVNKYSLEKILNKNGFIFENIGKKEWLQAMFTKPTKERSRYVYLVSRLVQKYKLGLIVELLTLLGFYTPLVYLVNPKYRSR